MAIALLLFAPAAPAEEPPRPPTIRLEARPRPELVDCRTPVFAHEAVVPTGSAWKVGETAITFERAEGKEGKWSATVSVPGREAPARTTLATLPALLTVEVRGAPYGLSVRADPAGGGLRVASAQGAPVEVGKATAWIVDSDRDGVLGSGGDGLVAPGVRTVAPFAGEVWHADAAVALRRAEGASPGEWTRTDIPMPYPERESHSAAWRLVNWRRQQVGVRPAAYDPALEDGLRKHASYCFKNSYHGHDEDKARAGYTPEGAEAGRGAVLNYYWGPTSVLREIEIELATLFHRNQVLAGGLARTAMVLHEGMFGMRTTTDPEAPLLEAAVVFPPHGMQDAPLRFHRAGEIPMPWEGRIRSPGTAVAVLLPALHWSPDLPAPPTLSVEGPKGEVAGRFHHPGKAPAGVPKDYFAAVALIPEVPLPPATRFSARVRIPMAEIEGGGFFEYDWEFTTGK